MVGERVRCEVLAVLNGGPIPEEWNRTTVVLIPKSKNPERIKDFIPISLCNGYQEGVLEDLVQLEAKFYFRRFVI